MVWRRIHSTYLNMEPYTGNADEDIKTSIDGLKADESIHTTYLNIEPYTGNVDEDIRNSIDGL